MDRITLDASAVNQLDGLTQMVDLCDPSGRLLGQFIPIDDVGEVFDPSKWEELTPDVSEEELDLREKSTDWLTTEEMLAYLKNLENP